MATPSSITPLLFHPPTPALLAEACFCSAPAIAFLPDGTAVCLEHHPTPPAHCESCNGAGILAHQVEVHDVAGEDECLDCDGTGLLPRRPTLPKLRPAVERDAAALYFAARRLAAESCKHVWNDHGDWSECIDCGAIVERAVA